MKFGIELMFYHNGKSEPSSLDARVDHLFEVSDHSD